MTTSRFSNLTRFCAGLLLLTTLIATLINTLNGQPPTHELIGCLIAGLLLRTAAAWAEVKLQQERNAHFARKRRTGTPTKRKRRAKRR